MRPPVEQRLWDEADEVNERVAGEGDLYESAELTAYLNAALSRLVGEAPRPPLAPTPSVYVFESLGREAFADPAGRIYVSTALLVAMRSEDELATLLGHELSHVFARDAYRSKLYEERTDSGVARMKLSQAQELAADDYAMRIARANGYDGTAFIDVLRRLEDESPSISYVPAAWQTHPGIDERIERLRRRARKQWRSRSEERRARPYQQAVRQLWVVDAALALEVEDFDRVVASLDRADPDDGRVAFLRGEHLRLTSSEGRRADGVLQAYQEAAERSPEDPEILRALGLLLRDRGEDEVARIYLARYIEIDVDAPDRRVIERYLGTH